MVTVIFEMKNQSLNFMSIAQNVIPDVSTCHS